MQQQHTQLVIEVCAGTVESAIAAQAGGADRVELCDNLLEGGTTPSAGAIALAREQLGIKLHIIVRPRGGDFCYSTLELAIMLRDIETAKQLGADGVALGVLLPDGTIDADRTRTLIAAARPLHVTFHRAFDMTRDPLRALDTLIDLGIERVLTSGQAGSAIEGIDLIAELVRHAGDRIIVMPGGGVERNVAKLVRETGVREIHVSVKREVDSTMRFRNERVIMGGTLRPSEYTRSVADADRIRDLRRMGD